MTTSIPSRIAQFVGGLLLVLPVLPLVAQTPPPPPPDVTVPVDVPDFDPGAAPSETPELPEGALFNISTRGIIGAAAEQRALIGGLIVEGGPMRVLIRARGESLSGLAPEQLIDNPFIVLIDQNDPADPGDDEQIAFNDDFGNSPDLEEIQNANYAPGDSREAVIVATLEPGEYTVIAQPETGTEEGVGIVEIFDFSAETSVGGDFTGSFANLSTNGFVGNGDEALIGGYVVNDGILNIVSRGRGNSLGVGNPAPDPQMITVDQSDGTQISFVNNFAEASALTELTERGLLPGDPSEAAELIEVGPGEFTVIINNAGAGVPGTGIVEIFPLALNN
jgi:hypothetical protein